MSLCKSIFLFLMSVFMYVLLNLCKCVYVNLSIKKFNKIKGQKTAMVLT